MGRSITWTAEICSKTGEVTAINQFAGSLKLKEPMVVRGCKTISVLLNAKNIPEAHTKCVEATRQITMYEGI